MGLGQNQTGMSVTIEFEDSQFEAQVTGIGGGELVREFYDATHFGSPAGTDHNDIQWMEQSPADLGSVNDITVEMLWDLDELPPIDQPIEQITITAPPKVGQVSGATLVFDGGMKQWGGTFAMRDRRRGSFIIAVSGAMEFTPGASS